MGGCGDGMSHIIYNQALIVYNGIHFAGTLDSTEHSAVPNSRGAYSRSLNACHLAEIARLNRESSEPVRVVAHLFGDHVDDVHLVLELALDHHEVRGEDR